MRKPSHFFTAKTQRTQRHRSLDSRSTGRTATVRNRGIEVLQGRSPNAHACRSTFQHLGSHLRRAHPAFGGFKFADIPESQVGRLPRQLPTTGKTSTPPPFKNRESANPAPPRRSRRAVGTTSRGIDRTGQKRVFGASRRFHGGGGRRPTPTPPRAPDAMLRVLCAFAVQPCDVCDVAMSHLRLSALSAVFPLRCAMPQSNAMNAMSLCAMLRVLCVFAVSPER